MAGERILVVDDEETIADLVCDGLRRQGFRPEKALDGDRALERIEMTRPDLVILDLMLPGLDGWEICRRMKDSPATKEIPVIMLTARRDERDVVAGLELGADDYLRKPFSLLELVARVKALLRRAGSGEEESTALRCGPLRLDLKGQEAFLDESPLDLSPTEYRILEVLARNAGRTVSRDELLARIWGLYGGDSRTVDVHIWRLRRKIETTPESPRLIETLRGRGYRLRRGGDGS
ncbi:MAG: response regulator transcription factor [Synergistaceae bacterium]|jgi:two-component system phosphate regulon response regulator PhoB/two-component system alkaline phosphatase synthesis response regulator PhoP|nr:response regulator transcription factor [Synergistaceae bacterium]